MGKYVVETRLICEIVIEAESYTEAREKVDQLEEAGLCWDHYVVDQTKIEIDYTYTEKPVTNIQI
jgi:23S rRNA maturation-related 3'-5' exoribonuclease YhaM